jgi:hypothetical protein
VRGADQDTRPSSKDRSFVLVLDRRTADSATRRRRRRPWPWRRGATWRRRRRPWPWRRGAWRWRRRATRRGRRPAGRRKLGTAGSVTGRRLTRPRWLGISARSRPVPALAIVPKLLVDGPVREREHEDHHEAHQRDQQQKSKPCGVAGLGEDLDRSHDRHDEEDELKDKSTSTGSGCGGQNIHARPPLRGCAPAPPRSDADRLPCQASVDRTHCYRTDLEL